MKPSLSEEEFTLAVAFLDGKLAEPELARFELRLAAEPELAAAVEALFEIDEGLRRHAARRRVREASRRERPIAGRRWWIAAIAAVVLATLVIALRERGVAFRPDVRVLVAVLPGDESPRDFVERSELLRGLRPPGLEVLRAGAEEPNVSAADFTAKARAHEEELARAALAAGAGEARGGYFVVPIETEASRTAVVLAIPERGAPLRLWPAPEDERPVAEQARLAAGRHLLPAERFELVEGSGEPTIEYHRGFLVPVGARALEVLVGTREEALDARTLEALDTALARGTAREEFARQGFTIRALRVVEPQGR